MSSFDIILMALKNLFKRKLRTFLTVLGVVIGTASIVIMVSLGLAMNESFEKQIEMMGDITKIEVYNPEYWNEAAADDSSLKLTRESVSAFKNIEGVKSATPVADAYLYIQCGKYYGDFSITGIDPAAMEDMGYKVSQGRSLNKDDEGTMNVVFGSELLSSFYKKGQQDKFYMNGGKSEEPMDVLNEKLKLSYDYGFSGRNADKSIKPYNIKAVGIYGEEFGNGYSVIMPIDAVEKIQLEQRKHDMQAETEKRVKTQLSKTINKGYSNAYVKCKDVDSVEGVVQQLKDMGYEVYSAMDSVSGMKKIAGSLQLLLGAIGFVSLLVAAIGITNTMIMSIYERTREIGIMKVIGARLKDIKRLFLLEAVLIGFMGGFMGVIISLGISAVLNNVGLSFLSEMQSVEGADISVIPAWLCIAAMAFSSVVGLISGYLPAIRAMKLSALNALRKS